MESPGRRASPAMPAYLRDLRSLRVAVFHPDDADGQSLVQQLARIGCRTQVHWPPPPQPAEGTDVVFLAVRPDLVHQDYPWAQGEQAPTVIAVVNYENPTIVEAVLRLGARAVLPAPVRSFGLLSILVLARQINGETRHLQRTLRKLETRLEGQRQIAKAAAILMRSKGISETQAYELIRKQAMARRVSTVDIATSLIHASELLDFNR